MKKLLFWGPVLTASGYGEHSRGILKALLDSGKFDVSVISVRWGQTPFLFEEDEFLNQVRQLAERGEEERKAGVKYDVAMQVTIPNEFKRMAPFHIGVTAGIEVDRVSPAWIEKANAEVDLVIVPSQHSAGTFAAIVYKDQSGQKELRLQKPVMVASEGTDTSVFKPTPRETTGVLQDMPDFNFLSVGLGLDKNFGEDRKNISGLVKAFCEKFKDDDRVGLVLKVSLVNGSLMDFETCRGRINEIKRMAGCTGPFPRIKLLHGRMSKHQLAALYRDPKIGAYVTLTHGEGYGLPTLEAAASGLPVLATNWSGHLDFLQLPDGKKRFIPIECEIKEVPQSAVWNGVIEPGTRWAYPSEKDAGDKMKKVFLSPETPNAWAAELAGYIARELDVASVGARLVEHLLPFLDRAAQQQPIDSRTAREKIREQLSLPPGKKVLLYTMPMSAGDVLVSTGVVSSLRKKFPEHIIIFATDPRYMDLLRSNPDIDKTIGFEQWMMDVPFLEGIFDEVYTPNLAIQLTTSNWVHSGKGRKLGDEMAAQCQVEFGDYRVNVQEMSGLPEKFVAFHPGSGQGQHEARNYRHWRKVIHNLTKSGITVVTVGQEGDIHFEGSVDLRGKTTYSQLAGVIQKASCLVGIDSVTMHMAAALGTPHVAIFGSSYAATTGPVYKDEANMQFTLLETKNRLGCEKACYKHQCIVDRESPCLNEIDPRDIVFYTVLYAKQNLHEAEIAKRDFEDIRPKISGYTHVLNAQDQGFPYIQSITSMLGFCDEVIVVDGGSTDGTLENIQEIGDPRIQVHTRKWDWNEPGMDGMQKAFGRAMCTGEFLWQQDADEVVSERDYEKVRKLSERFPSGTDLVHLPVVELWGGQTKFRTDRHSWKWRMSRNNFKVTHGINKAARVIEEKTGRIFAKKGMSDGCEYIDVLTGEYITHKGFYTQQLELLRKNNPEAYGREMNKIFGDLPSVFHYSWADIPRKVRNFRDFWDKCWSNLYNDPNPEPRFPDVKTDEDVKRKAAEVLDRGGEHGPAVVVPLSVPPPAIMVGWTGENRSDHDDSQQAGSLAADVAVAQQDDATRSVQADGRP